MVGGVGGGRQDEAAGRFREGYARSAQGVSRSSLKNNDDLGNLHGFPFQNNDLGGQCNGWGRWGEKGEAAGRVGGGTLIASLRVVLTV